MNRLALFLTILALSLSYGCHAADDPLIAAVKSGNTTAVQNLLNSGANVNIADPDGATALHWAAAADSFEIERMLLDRGANPNAAKKDGVRPLHVSAALGRVESIKLLIARGADRQAADAKGRTPLAVATERQQTAAVQVLQSATVTVTVTDSTGTPVSGAVVRGGEQDVATNASGQVLLFLDPGAAHLEAYKDGYGQAPPQDISVNTMGTYQVRFALPPSVGAVVGKLTQFDDKPVEGASVMLGPGNHTATTGADGSFTIPNVAPGSYQATFTKDGKPLGPPVAVTVTGGGLTRVDMKLPKPPFTRTPAGMAVVLIAILAAAAIVVMLVRSRASQGSLAPPEEPIAQATPATAPIPPDAPATPVPPTPPITPIPPLTPTLPVVTPEKAPVSPLDEFDLPGKVVATPITPIPPIPPVTPTPPIPPTPPIAPMTPTLPEDELWCVIAKDVEIETMVEAASLPADRAGSVRLDIAPGQVQIALRSLPQDQLKGALTAELVQILVSGFGIILGGFLWLWSFLMLIVAALRLFLADVFGFQAALAELWSATVGIFWHIRQVFVSISDAIKISKAMKTGVGYIIVPEGAKPVGEIVASFARGDESQILLLSMTDRGLQKVMRSRNRARGCACCLNVIGWIVLLPFALIRLLLHKKRPESYCILAFISGQPIDLTPPTGILDKQKRKLRKRGSFLARPKRKVHFIPIDPSRAESTKKAIEDALGREVPVLDENLASQTIWL